jgi:hypothetical protein
VGKNQVSLMFTPFGYSTDTVLATALNYNGVTYNSGTVVHSDLSYSMFDLKYQRDLINREISSRVFSGRHCSDQVFYEEFKMNAAGSGFNQKKSFDSVIPMIGFGAHIGLVANLLELRAQATAKGYGSDNYSYEALADLFLTPFPFRHRYPRRL